LRHGFFFAAENIAQKLFERFDVRIKAENITLPDGKLVTV
jgi:hypothetical protein